jgi:cation diffusion facilitator CzcD-associated flavoprotein CzcO
MGLSINAEAPQVETLIIGSGFAGLCMAIHLRRRNRPFMVLERGADIGGTWRDNTYPGAACDIPSHLYSFSFEGNATWSRTYPTQPELLAYLKRCADKYKLRPDIRLNTEVREALFDETNDLWRVRTQTGETITTRILITGMGPLSRPAYPTIPGLERFQGRTFHSARWDHGFDLRGKRVGVIGTGASAIQFIPHIAPQVAQLYVFQRTPPWIMPKNDRPIRAWQQFLFRWAPGYRRMVRDWIYWGHEFRAFAFTKNLALLKHAQKKAERHITAGIADAALRSRVTPDYLLGCKRILVSNDYYPTLERRHVQLVTDGIAEVRQHSIVSQDGTERPVDAIIYATGFRNPGVLAPLRILGRNQIDLNDAWAKGAKAYLGVTVPGYPNFFMMVGPNSGVGHTSTVFMIEAQAHYIMKCLERMRRRGAVAMDLQPEIETHFNRWVQARMQKTAWTSGCRSRYLDERGINTTLWPGFSCHFWMKTRRVKERDYLLTRT